jgi:DUF1680 family protein
MSQDWLPVGPRQVKILDGFWKNWRDLIGKVTLFHEYSELQRQGHLEALLLDPKKHRGREEKDGWYWGGSIFWDSDLAKWLEAAAARLENAPDPDLEKLADQLIACLAGSQQPDGYLNSHILTWRPGHRFKNLRDLHELYCAGHLIEAAVVHFEATGKKTLLNIAIKYADYINQTFGPGAGQLNGYCGHPEIELALVRLYRLTEDDRYLKLSRFFVEQRGRQPHYFDQERINRLDLRPFRPRHPESPYAYMQAHKPVREQEKVVGHAVRAMYLLCAVADLAKEFEDDALRKTCQRLWDDLCQTKLYVTGGIGSAADNEGFTADFDLPNEKAYAETCASIGLFLFAHRMIHLDLRSCYADVMETALYNNILSGLGLDGKSFFYENPLASRGSHRRVAWPWWCPCCPPNLARLILSLSGYLFSNREDAIAVHHYVNSEARFSVAGDPVQLRVETELPFGGRSKLTFNHSGTKQFTLMVRQPWWASGIKVRVNGKETAPELSNGYACLERNWSSADVLELELGLPVIRQVARYEVESLRGRVAISRGPLVYCLEEADNGENLDQLVLKTDAVLSPKMEADLLGGVVVLEGDAERETVKADGLYSTRPPSYSRTAIRAIPYYAWDNRAPGEMLVWMRCRGG